MQSIKLKIIIIQLENITALHVTEVMDEGTTCCNISEMNVKNYLVLNAHIVNKLAEKLQIFIGISETFILIGKLVL